MEQRKRLQLPRKEDLLPKINPKELPEQSDERRGKNTDPVAKSQADSEIALNYEKQVQAETNAMLLKQGYKSIEDGLKDIEQKRQDIDQRLESARQIENEAIGLRNQTLTIKENALLVEESNKQRRTEIQSLLSEITDKENEINKELQANIKTLEELNATVTFHQETIIPCRNALVAVSRSIYKWLDLLNDTGYDFTRLYNYIGKALTVIDRYIDRTNKTFWTA